MEHDDLIRRKIYAEVPLRVEYSLTEIGSSLSPILNALHEWGTQYRTFKKEKGSRKTRRVDRLV